ncbi:MAG: hypothetical protein BZY88_10465 [SAR202 cluster bacterium Io17-Chloro-G9]|nr:MAG: hypothetical protein BZY88_10465 [SAR202 cluster bacterium Io17-Chloro-G9]
MLEQAGRPPRLVVKDLPVPVPEPGEALVQVAACGFCHHDLLVMTGVLRRGVNPEIVLGHELSGQVVSVGEGVTSVSPGDRVSSILTNSCGRCDRCRQGREHRCRYGMGIGHGRHGGFAEYVCVAEASLVSLPGSVDLIGAALFACPMGVALQAVKHVARVQPGETVVVTGGGGGLGTHAVQIAAALGGRVIAVTSSPDKVGYLEELGASEVLEAGDPGAESEETLDFSELVMAFTEDEGAEVVIDTVGSPLFDSTWQSLGQYGRMVLLGEVAGEAVKLNLAEIVFRDAQILGSSGVSRALVQEISEMVSQGTVRPVAGKVLPLEEAATAIEDLSNRSVLGRIVLTPQG